MKNASVQLPASVEDPKPASAGRLMIIDDDRPSLELLKQVLTHYGYEVVTHSSPREARQFFHENRQWPELVLTDLMMPGEDGLSLLRSFHEHDDSVVGIVITGYGTMEKAVDAMRAGVFDFISKPFDAVAVSIAVRRGLEHRRVLVENRNYQRRMEELVKERSAALREALRHLKTAYQFTLESLVSMLEAREKATGEHSKRVTSIAMVLARALGVSGNELEIIREGAFLHDIGKVAIPDHILQKPGRLDADEWEIMKTHVEAGYEILCNNPDIREVAEIVHSHHEHYDGSGYPRGLKGEEICFGARIFAVADAYDAIRFERPYSPARAPEETLREIVRCRGTQFDPLVVDVLSECQADIERVWGNDFKQQPS